MNTQDQRSYWQSMNYEEKLFFAVKNGNAATFAYSRLNLHWLEAKMQMQRIIDATNSRPVRGEPAQGASQEEMRAYVRDGVRSMQFVLAEVHLYFVAWSGCRNMLQVLVGQPELLEAKKVFDSHKHEFEHYVAGRNSFEHFHERLPGQRNADRVKEVQPDPRAGAHRVFAGIHGGVYKHSDLEWDITPASLGRLDRFLSEILAVVHKRIEEEFIKKGLAS